MSSMTKLVVSSCAVTLSFFAGTGIASAAPDVSRIVNSTCSYPQVINALNAQNPEIGAQFTASPAATGWLQALIASGPGERRAMVQQAQGLPVFNEYAGLINSVASSCNNY
jgi:hemophore-related protein